MIKTITKTCLLICSVSALPACSTVDKLSKVGEAPEVTQIVNPQIQPDYKPVSMPMPVLQADQKTMNSLWSAQKTTFFEDNRARRVGDILTVLIDIEDEASINNKTDHSRASSEDAGLGSLLGIEQSLHAVLPEAVDNTNLVNGAANSSYEGEGTTEREEEIQLKLAAVILQELPNGNLVIQGNQEVRVNYEKRVLQLAGIIRRSDINTDNTISYDKIAEARITYGGEGHITNVQQPRYGQQVYDVLFPF